MADTIWVLCGGGVEVRNVKADLLGGPWAVTPATDGDGFAATHVPTGMAAAINADAHKARAVADALNRYCRVRSLQDAIRQRHVIEAITGATIEGVEV